MNEPELSRRKILSSLAVAGGAGSLVGGGTGAFVTNALFSDSETFAGNTIQTSENVGGVVDMDVTLEELDGEDGVRYRISLPEATSGSKNNPAYIWLRTLTCPEPEGLAERILIAPKISYDGGDSYYEIFGETKSVQEALNGIRTGINLGQWADEPCLQPGDEWLIEVPVESVEPEQSNSGNNGNSGNSGGSTKGEPQLDFELEFHGQQCRYQSGSENPFEPSSVIADCDSDDGKNAISFIAFCAGETDLTGAIESGDLTVTKSKDGGEPLAVEWESDEAVETVVVKAGRNIENFYIDGSKQGTVEVGTGEPAVEGQSSSSPCPSGDGPKFEWNEDGKEFNLDGGEKKGGNQ
jgi:hypothetical protein